MKTSFDFFYAVPFPHVIATITVATALSILAILSGYWMAIPIAYAALFFYTAFEQKQHQSFVLILCMLFSTGAFLQIKQMRNNYNSQSELLHKSLTLQGVICQINNSSLAKEQTTILLHATSATNHELKESKISKNILIYAPTKRTFRLQEGQTIEISQIKLTKPEVGCEYESYLIKENIWASAFIASNKIIIKNDAGLPIHKRYFNLFTSQLSKRATSLFSPLFLGRREKNLDTVAMQHNSIYLGIAHHMARSGIHLVTIFGLLMTCLHYLRIRHSYRYFLGTLLSIGYFEITYPSISFVRALFMILFQMFSKMNKFTYSSIHALTTTTLIILMHNPLQILFLDFQLSFGVTYIIIWLFRAKYSKTVAFAPASFIRS
ncbi:MAG: ComEC/Rec2 family competence protein [Candidatus Dependentiae bacterium]|nr:ComEC/Rec2 family competence protein [Candidatus Dependentiae bacterium]